MLACPSAKAPHLQSPVVLSIWHFPLGKTRKWELWDPSVGREDSFFTFHARVNMILPAAWFGALPAARGSDFFFSAERTVDLDRLIASRSSLGFWSYSYVSKSNCLGCLRSALRQPPPSALHVWVCILPRWKLARGRAKREAQHPLGPSGSGLQTCGPGVSFHHGKK